MKPFDLEAAKRGEPIVCGDGTPVKLIAHVPEAHFSERVVVLIEGMIKTRNEEGSVNLEAADLFMAPKKRKGWTNVYRETRFSRDGDERCVLNTIYPNENDARHFGRNSPDYIATVPIEWEEP